MAKLNLLVFLNGYSDVQSSNAPSLNNFKWDREINSMTVDVPEGKGFTLAPGETKTLFNGTRTLAQDGTTQYSIAVKPLASSTYVLSAVSGTLPNFRTPRTTGADATTQVTVTSNGPLLTFASTGGTPFSLSGVQVGDLARLGSNFNLANQGEFKILAFTSTSFTVENEVGVPEGPITLGSGFAAQVSLYSAAGVQVGDTLKISGGFSLVTQGSYAVTAVGANFLEFSSTDILPQESNIQTQAIAVYSEAKQLVYLESDQNVDMIINGIDGGNIEPFVDVASNQPGVFLRKATMYSMTVTNTSTDTANLFFASVA